MICLISETIRNRVVYVFKSITHSSQFFQKNEIKINELNCLKILTTKPNMLFNCERSGLILLLHNKILRIMNKTHTHLVLLIYLPKRFFWENQKICLNVIFYKENIFFLPAQKYCSKKDKFCQVRITFGNEN